MTDVKGSASTALPRKCRSVFAPKCHNCTPVPMLSKYIQSYTRCSATQDECKLHNIQRYTRCNQSYSKNLARSSSFVRVVCAATRMSIQTRSRFLDFLKIVLTTVAKISLKGHSKKLLQARNGGIYKHWACV